MRSETSDSHAYATACPTVAQSQVGEGAKSHLRPGKPDNSQVPATSGKKNYQSIIKEIELLNDETLRNVKWKAEEIQDGARHRRNETFDAYNEYWGNIWSFSKELVGERNEDELSRVWAMLNHFEFFSDKTLGQAFKSADQSMVITGHQLPSSLPMATFMGTLRYTVVYKLLQHVLPTSDALVELGSGWGRNVFSLQLYGMQRGIPIYAGEFTKSGRRVTRLLNQLRGTTSRVTSFEFDYYNLDVSLVKKAGHKHVTIMTLWSIEQVRTLPADFVDTLLTMGKSVNGIHMEPIDWQENPDSPLGKISKERGLHSGYNENLVALLKEAQEQKKIIIDEITPEFAWGSRAGGMLVTWHSV